MNSIVEKTQVKYLIAYESFSKFTQHLQVLQFMVDEKLPKEIAAKKLELQVYEDVINEKNIDKQYLNNLQSQVSWPTIHYAL